MSRILRDRSTRGSVGLLVFALFLLSVFVAAMPAQAANPPGVPSGTHDVTQGSTVDKLLSDHNGTLTVTLRGVTGPFPDTVTVWILNNGTWVSRTAYATHGSSQQGAVVLTIYGVYDLAYQSWQIPGDLVYAGVYAVNGTVYSDVYLELPTQPPNYPSVPPTTGQTISTPAGTITVDTTAGKAELQVDPTKLAQQVTSAPLVTITIPADVSVPQVTVTLPSDAIQNLVQQQKGLEIQGKGLDVKIPQAVLNLPGLPAGASLTVTVAQASADQSQQLLGSTQAAANPDYHGISNVYTLELGFKSADGQTTAFTGTFPQPVTVGFTYDAGKLGALPTWKLGAYRIDPATGSLTYVGGRVRGDQVQADLAHFSNYAVLAYDVAFRDVPAGYWAQQDIEMMASKHVVGGIGAGLFAPEQGLTRAQMAAMLVRALGLNVDPSATAPFSDVKAGQWFTAEVAAAYRAGIVNGYPNGSFQPNRLVSRQEIATMLVRAARLRQSVPSLTASQAASLLARFTDQAQVASWARVDMAVAVQLGLVQGRTPTTLAPTADTKRSEAATLMRRVMETLSII